MKLDFDKKQETEWVTHISMVHSTLEITYLTFEIAEMLFKAILIFSLGVLVGVFVIRSGKIGTKTAIILSLGFVGATFLYQYYSLIRLVCEFGGKTEKSFKKTNHKMLN